MKRMGSICLVKRSVDHGPTALQNEAHQREQGISMPLAQFSTLVTLLPHIETVLKGKGEELPRPNYGGAEDGGDDEEEEEGGKEGKEAEDDDDEDVEEEKPSKKGKKGKRNFEETSDED